MCLTTADFCICRCNALATWYEATTQQALLLLLLLLRLLPILPSLLTSYTDSAVNQLHNDKVHCIEMFSM